MDHRDHVALLAPGVAEAPRGPGVTWADIGGGGGAFTRALADLLGPGARIIAIDRDPGALEENRARTMSAFPQAVLETRVADFTESFATDPLDGIVAANSLHFVPPDRQADVVRRLARLLRPGCPFLVVEYDAERGNRWVPYPFTFRGWERIATAAGLVDPQPLHRVPSSWLGGIYSAAARRPADDGA